MQQCIWSIFESCFRPIQLETPGFAGFLTILNRRATSYPLLWQGTRSPSRNSSSSAAPTPERRPRVSPTTTLLVEAYTTADLTEPQVRAFFAAELLATNATIMAAARSHKDATAAFADDTPTKASPSVSNKRRRRPGEQRFYAVRAGKIPGVYLTWAECQAMINGFAGANCKLPNVLRPRLSLFPPFAPFNQHLTCTCPSSNHAILPRQVLCYPRGG